MGCGCPHPTTRHRRQRRGSPVASPTARRGMTAGGHGGHGGLKTWGEGTESTEDRGVLVGGREAGRSCGGAVCGDCAFVLIWWRET